MMTTAQNTAAHEISKNHFGKAVRIIGSFICEEADDRNILGRLSIDSDNVVSLFDFRWKLIDRIA